MCRSWNSSITSTAALSKSLDARTKRAHTHAHAEEKKKKTCIPPRKYTKSKYFTRSTAAPNDVSPFVIFFFFLPRQKALRFQHDRRRLPTALHCGNCCTLKIPLLCTKSPVVLGANVSCDLLMGTNKCRLVYPTLNTSKRGFRERSS